MKKNKKSIFKKTGKAFKKASSFLKVKKLSKKSKKKIRKIFSKKRLAVSLGMILFLVLASGLIFQNRLRRSVANQLIIKGNYYFNGGKYDLPKAEKMYDWALKIYPQADRADYQLARIHLVENKFNLARQEIDQSLTLNPQNKRAYYIRGLIDGYAKKYVDAIEDYRKFVAWAPTEWAGYNDLAWVYFENKNYEKTRETAQEGLDKTGADNPWLLNGLGVAYINLDEPQKAQEEFDKVKKISQSMTPHEWASAYPGNDPASANWNLKKFKQDVNSNSQLASAGFTSGGTYVSACCSSSCSSSCNRDCFEQNCCCNVSSSSWSPRTNTVCSGHHFTQTSNCGTHRGATGTKNCCNASSWSPGTNTVCSGQHFTQTSNCGTHRGATGTKNCSCTVTSWSPATNTVCSGASFTQTSNCGTHRTVAGTDNSCPGVNLTASPNPVAYNTSSNLTWTTTNANSCQATGNWSGSKNKNGGTESTGSLTSSKTYSIECWNSSGVSSGVKSVTVNVGAPSMASCGGNAQTYPSFTDQWPSNSSSDFCSSGTPNPSNPTFPDPGATTNWTCNGSVPCSASRHTEVWKEVAP